MVAFPAVLLIVMFALQFGLYLHAAQIAEAAAQEAVEAAQVETAGVAEGRAAAAVLLRELPALRGPTIAVERTATIATARISGHAQQLVPGLDLRVVAAAQGPIERFVPEPAP